MFVERALANHSKHILLSLADRETAVQPGIDDAEVQMMRDDSRQQRVQEQLKQQQEQLHQQRLEIQQLREQLQRLQK